MCCFRLLVRRMYIEMCKCHVYGGHLWHFKKLASSGKYLPCISRLVLPSVDITTTESWMEVSPVAALTMLEILKNLVKAEVAILHITPVLLRAQSWAGCCSFPIYLQSSRPMSNQFRVFLTLFIALRTEKKHIFEGRNSSLYFHSMVVWGNISIAQVYLCYINCIFLLLLENRGCVWVQKDLRCQGYICLRNMLHAHLDLNLSPLRLDLLTGFIVVSLLKLRLPDSLGDVNTSWISGLDFRVKQSPIIVAELWFLRERFSVT